MGGTNAGEVASAIAISSIQQAFTAEAITQAISQGKENELLCQAICQADNAIEQQMISHPETTGMGTTIVLCWVKGDRAHIAWCGDSRCYRYNTSQGLQPLTKDHSYVQELVDNGTITESEAFSHPDSNLITRALGYSDGQMQPDTVVTTIAPDDTLLLCSDGLCGYCTNNEIAHMLETCHDAPFKTADRLLRMALDAGSEDNITVAVASLLADDAQAPSPSKLRQFLKNVFG